jgi:hypothetical protein
MPFLEGVVVAHGKGHSGTINAVKISPDEKVLSFFLSSILSGTLLLPSDTLTNTYTLFSFFWQTIVSVGSTGEILFWEMPSAEKLRQQLNN